MIDFHIPIEVIRTSNSLTLDDCTMEGDRLIDVRVEECRVRFEFGQTFVTVVPSAAYDNSLQIVRLFDTDSDNLFIVPRLPGDFYNITVDIYSQN